MKIDAQIIREIEPINISKPNIKKIKETKGLIMTSSWVSPYPNDAFIIVIILIGFVIGNNTNLK